MTAERDDPPRERPRRQRQRAHDAPEQWIVWRDQDGELEWAATALRAVAALAGAAPLARRDRAS